MPRHEPPTTTQRDGRQAVLDAAISLFTEVGYHGTSVRQIASTAGLKVPSMYHHYPSKQAILQAIMERVLSDVIAHTRGAVTSVGDAPSAQFRALMYAWVLFHTQRRGEALIGASELRSLDKDGLERIVALRDEQESLFRAVINAGVAAGEFSTPHPREAARAVINMGRSVASWFRPEGPRSATTLAAEYADLALAMVQVVDR